MATYLITGASRGMGLEMVRYLASSPPSEVSVVFATARSESVALKDISSSSSGRVCFVKLDTTDEENIKDAVTQVESVLGSQSLDVLVNNAGATAWTEGWAENGFDLKGIMDVNVIGVQLVTQNFLPLMRKSSVKKIASM
jgi:NAD(P)-dependent dehydrogenase (short-subunit alcohol dehydrogenase family)